MFQVAGALNGDNSLDHKSIKLVVDYNQNDSPGPSRSTSSSTAERAAVGLPLFIVPSARIFLSSHNARFRFKINIMFDQSPLCRYSR